MADFGSAVFRHSPFPVPAGGHTFDFPSLTGRQWLTLLSSENWVSATVGELDEETHERFVDLVESGELEPAHVRAFAHAALAGAAGRPWWEAQRLSGACFNDNGRLLGTALLSGADPERMTLAAFLACVWATLTKGADATQIVKLEAELLIPPAEATPEERADIDDDMGPMVERLRGMPGVSIG
ncbi:MAG TPA: hypothetical protein VFX97_20625 [Pyrinomonadaceae bacterium]|nr:hypothetical protein [Pyrinomonadaceae bacterium]